MNLGVIVMTSFFNDIYRIIPKVCYKIGDKSMLEIVLENVSKLNPKIIILMIEKNNIININKLIKHADYAKLISYCIFDNQKINNFSIAKKCYTDKNVLVVPGICPLLTTRSMYKMISLNRNVKINDYLFYLKKSDLEKIDDISEYFSNDENLLPEKETMKIENRKQLEKINKKLFDK